MLRVTSLWIRLTLLETYNYFPLNIHIELSPPGWGYASIWEMGVYMALYGDTTKPRVFGVHNKPHCLLLIGLYELLDNPTT
jgi:hypothetical protein